MRGCCTTFPSTAITPLVADTAVRGDPRMIQWVPRELRTADMCLYAEAAHPELRVYVPDEIAKGRNIYSFHRQVDAKLRQPLEYEQYKTLYSGGAVRVNNVWTSVAGEIDCCEVRYDRKAEKLKLRIRRTAQGEERRSRRSRPANRPWAEIVRTAVVLWQEGCLKIARVVADTRMKSFRFAIESSGGVPPGDLHTEGTHYGGALKTAKF